MTKRGLGWGLGLVALVSVFGASGLAHAATVECDSKFGSCEVSNDGADSITCSCGESSGTGMTGGDELDGLDEDELLDICESSLEICEFEGSGESGPMTTTVGTDTESGTDSETDPSATSIADTGDPTDSATGPGTTGATGESGTGESGTTDADTTAAETGAETTDAETTAAETTDAESTGVSATGASATGASATGASATGSSDSDDETSSSSAGENEDSSGCSCDASGRDRSGLLGFGLLAALGLRRRRRAG